MSISIVLQVRHLTKEQVTPTEKYLLQSLALRANEEGLCWPSIDCMCDDTNLDRRTIIRLRKSLINKGFISYIGDTKGKSNQIPIMKITIVTSVKNDTVSTEESVQFATPTSDIVSPLPVTLCHPEYKGENKLKNKQKEKVIEGSQASYGRSPQSLPQEVRGQNRPIVTDHMTERAQKPQMEVNPFDPPWRQDQTRKAANNHISLEEINRMIARSCP